MTALYCILCVWNEEDIIGSTIQHAYAQGCDKVFIIDNDSSDKTVQQAIRAGAVYHARFSTKYFDETQKTVYINKSVLHLSKQSPVNNPWWLYIDADEFPDFHNGKTIKQNLNELPDDVRAVGGYACNHIPTHEPYFIPGYHPADFMPVGKIQRKSIWKYGLLRHDKNQPPMYAKSGFHTYNANGGAVREADVHYIIHHFNYRKQDTVSRRLQLLLKRDEYGKSRVDWYDNMAKVNGGTRSAYHGRLENMRTLYEENRYGNLKIDTPDYNYNMVCRWYDPLQLEETIGSQLKGIDYLIFCGTLLYNLGNYEKALFAFHDAQQLASSDTLQGLLLLSMARCYKKMNDSTFSMILNMLAAHSDEEIRHLSRELDR